MYLSIKLFNMWIIDKLHTGRRDNDHKKQTIFILCVTITWEKCKLSIYWDQFINTNQRFKIYLKIN